MSLLDDAADAWDGLDSDQMMTFAAQGITEGSTARAVFIAGFMAGVQAVAEHLNDDSPGHKYKNFETKGATDAAWSATVRLDQAYMSQLNELLGRDPQEHW